MTDKFFLLENDEKTFLIVDHYIFCIQNNIDLLKEDNKHQIKEMQDHYYNCGKNGNNWIDYNAAKMRVYYNSCKELAFIYICMDVKLTKENFSQFIIKFNSCYDTILNKIF